jgi:hypothetical protein
MAGDCRLARIARLAVGAIAAQHAAASVVKLRAALTGEIPGAGLGRTWLAAAPVIVAR